MIHGLYVIHRASGRLMFEKKLENFAVDTDLFSALLAAIRAFAEEIHMGELTSFTTHNKKIVLSLTETLIIALILEAEASSEKYQGIAYEIGRQFDIFYKIELNNWSGNRSLFSSFKETVETILNIREDPFIVQVAKWASREYGGDIHLDQELITSTNDKFLVNLVIDRGILKDLAFREKVLTKFHKGYNREIIFFKITEDVLGLNDMENFLYNCMDLGYECSSKARCDQYFDYFPSKILLIAPQISPNVLERITTISHYDKKQAKHFIISSHLMKPIKHTAIKGKLPMFQCLLELWQWKKPYPERIFS